MTRRLTRRLLLPLFLSLTLSGSLPAGAADDVPANDVPAAASGEGRSPVEPAASAGTNEQAAPAKNNDGNIAVTRSDGSTGRSRQPDPKEVRKLVSSIRDGMKRADRVERQRLTKRVIQYRPARTRR